MVANQTEGCRLEKDVSDQIFSGWEVQTMGNLRKNVWCLRRIKKRMDNFKNLKGIKTLIDARENLRSNFVVITEVLEQTKNLKKKALEVEEASIKEMPREIGSLNDKIKGICTKAELNLEESGFVDKQQSEVIFRTSIYKRLTEVNEHLRDSTVIEGDYSVLPLMRLILLNLNLKML